MSVLLLDQLLLRRSEHMLVQVDFTFYSLNICFFLTLMSYQLVPGRVSTDVEGRLGRIADDADIITRSPSRI